MREPVCASPTAPLKNYMRNSCAQRLFIFRAYSQYLGANIARGVVKIPHAMKIATGKGTISLFQLLAIWSVSAVTSLPGLAISPILEDLSHIFPTASQLEIQMLSSLPSLLIIPFVLLAGWLSVKGQHLKLLSVGLLIFLLSGIASILSTKIGALIAASCIMGAGAGVVVPFSTGLVVQYFTGNYRVKQLGISSAINNLALVAATSVVSLLAQRSWHDAFMVYLLPAVTLLLLLALRNTAPAPEPKGSDQLRQTKIKGWRLAGLTALYFTITLTTLVITFYLSFLVERENFPQEISSIMISLFFLAIMLPGLLLSRIIAKLRSSTIQLSLVAIIVGLLLVGTIPDIPLMLVGVALTGLGYGVLQPIIYDKAAIIAPPHLATRALAVVMTANYVAVVACPVVIDFVKAALHQSNESFPFIASAVVVSIVAALGFIYRKSFIFSLDKSYYHREK